jgi:hypothetical protein
LQNGNGAPRIALYGVNALSAEALAAGLWLRGEIPSSQTLYAFACEATTDRRHVRCIKAVQLTTDLCLS